MIENANALFMKNAEGEICIAFDDALYVRAESVFIDPASRQVTGLIDGMPVPFGVVSAKLASHFLKASRVLLTAPHPAGFDVTIHASLRSLH